jgi:deoxyribodipyrimidine photolyase-related protein
LSSALLILGNQLFPIEHIKKLKFDKILMFEDLGLCEHFKYHKHKIIFFLSAMRHYRDELIRNGFDVYYLQSDQSDFKNSFESKLDAFFNNNLNYKEMNFFEIEDKFFENRIKKYVSDKKFVSVEIQSPLFLSSRQNFKDYLLNVKKPFMKTFYERERKRLNILVDKNKKPEGGSWSYDQENRKKLPKDVKFPEFYPSLTDEITEDVMFFVESVFPDHPGDSENFWIPVTRDDSLAWLKVFIAERLDKFGDYQDAITDQSEFVFHSLISPMLNIGLILPDEVISLALKSYEDSNKTLPLNSLEGFIRQVIGWREFIRGIYQNYDEQQSSGNFWNHHRKLKPCWYEGQTGIPVLDYSIKKAVKWGYNHHIERLMVVSNLMLLSEVHPQEVYKWFMEMFVDSSDWVMGPNVYGMGQFSDGGIFATKPYICGSNYYLKMSSFPKGEWCDTVDGLYWRFIDKHQEFYRSNPRMSMMVHLLNKMDLKKKQRIFKLAEKFIQKTTD